MINLGTNDFKGTEANNLTDAVDASTLGQHLQSLLEAASGIPHVMLVNIWANTKLAPTTMKNVADTPSQYADATSAAGVTLINWAKRARENIGLIGDDGVHDSGDGEATRVNLITSAVSSNCG